MEEKERLERQQEFQNLVEKVNLPSLWEDPQQDSGLMQYVPVINLVVTIILLVLMYMKK